jgi:hypothetical protein
MRKLTWILLGALLTVSVGAIGASGIGAKMGQQLMTLATALAGERNEDSTTGTDYASVSRECDPQAAIDLSTDASTTITGPTILCGYALTVTIGTEAATIDDNTTAKVDLPLAWPIGNYTNIDLLFRTSLVVNPGTNSTGTLRIWTRPGDAGVTR